MTILLNYLLPLLLAGVVYYGYKTKNYVVSACVALFMVIAYQAIQPTILPKGTVPAMRITPAEYVDKPILDRTKKVMTVEERDARMNEAKEKIAARIEQEIENQTKE